MLLKEAVEIYLSGLRLPGGDEHQEQARIILNRAVEWFATDHEHCKAVLELTDLRKQALIEFLAYRKTCRGIKKGSTLSQSTLSKEARYLKCLLNAISEDTEAYDLPETWVPPRVPRIKVPKKIPRALEHLDLDRVFRACENATLPQLEGITAVQWWFSLLYLAYLTSMRRRALFNIPRPTDQELDSMLLFLPASANKSNADQYFPLTRMACDLIRALPGKPGQPMFTWQSRRGRQNFRSFYHQYSQMQKKAGIADSDQSRLHTLRKTGLTYMARAGVGMSTVKEQAGHSDISLTANYYIGVMGDSRKDAVDNLPSPKNLRGKQKQLFD
jgi:integrase